jgi:hypothetical protein
MKAVFKRTALDRVMEIIHNAMRDRKTIDYIVVTPQEWSELRSTEFGYHLNYPSYKSMSATQSMVFDYVDLKLRDDRSGYYTRSFMIEQVTVCDQRIVVAPIEYHPL